MPYVTKAQKEMERWMTVIESLKHIIKVELGTDESEAEEHDIEYALREMINAVKDGKINLRWKHGMRHRGPSIEKQFLEDAYIRLGKRRGTLLNIFKPMASTVTQDQTSGHFGAGPTEHFLEAATPVY